MKFFFKIAEMVMVLFVVFLKVIDIMLYQESDLNCSVSEKIIAFLLSYICFCRPSRSASDLNRQLFSSTVFK